MEKKFIDKHVGSATLITTGLNISKEIACGKIVFNSQKAHQLAQQGEQVILVKEDINPEDIEVLKESQGFIFTHRNTLMYALLMSKTLKKSCLFANNIDIDYDNNLMKIGSNEYKEGTVVSLDGETGNIYLGAIPQVHIMGYDDLLRQNLKNRTEKIYSMNSQR